MGTDHLKRLKALEKENQRLRRTDSDLTLDKLTLAEEIGKIERQLLAWHRQNQPSQRLETIPGIGIITATALAASVPDPTVFRSARQFAAWLGLVPRQNSSGGKDRLGPVSKMGNRYLRRLLVVGATSVTRRAATTRHADRCLGQIAP